MVFDHLRGSSWLWAVPLLEADSSRIAEELSAHIAPYVWWQEGCLPKAIGWRRMSS